MRHCSFTLVDYNKQSNAPVDCNDRARTKLHRFYESDKLQGDRYVITWTQYYFPCNHTITLRQASAIIGSTALHTRSRLEGLVSKVRKDMIPFVRKLCELDN